MWTAAADPHVLRARILAPSASGGAIDLYRFPHFVRRGEDCCHVRFDLHDGALRLDLVGDFVTGGGCIEPALDLGRDLESQLAAIRRLDALLRGCASPSRDQRFVRHVEALRAADALAAGASLRDIALGILGEDWPGDGEHLKSRARRRVRLAAELMRAGPSAVLARTI
ncbi:DUF2285 domain-containing protein [Sphingomonas sp.]|uniref:DNA -binding domain-containing protein n=1 Tax=Sphingomonas sp. TaxID=28214 RepID=UPI002600CFCD|nr:DUF2285 domain-containing protein [Sphingomonas sp.]